MGLAPPHPLLHFPWGDCLDIHDRFISEFLVQSQLLPLLSPLFVFITFTNKQLIALFNKPYIFLKDITLKVIKNYSKKKTATENIQFYISIKLLYFKKVLFGGGGKQGYEHKAHSVLRKLPLFEIIGNTLVLSAVKQTLCRVVLEGAEVGFRTETTGNESVLPRAAPLADGCWSCLNTLPWSPVCPGKVSTFHSSEKQLGLSLSCRTERSNLPGGWYLLCIPILYCSFSPSRTSLLSDMLKILKH